MLEKIIKMENSLGAIFDEIPCTIAHGVWPNFEQVKKFIKTPILIGISSNLIRDIRTRMCIRKNIKMENSIH